MDWSSWSGFVGDGTYVIINKASLTALETRPTEIENDSRIQGFSPCPNNRAQLWYISKQKYPGEVYGVKNLHDGLMMTAMEPKGIIFGAESEESSQGQPHLDPCMLWAFDTGILGTERGNMVVFRNLKNPGSVLELNGGGSSNGTPVSILAERTGDDYREPQKWLLQIEKEFGDTCPVLSW